ncbi:hypothetical protein GCM10023169_09770 [Georgenia halophila]|uniref:DUF4190 domain-containing protein n=1 Tax=Georgenia halophila TaxID=620889 RepID=A0ABP8L0N4_9MICO
MSGGEAWAPPGRVDPPPREPGERAPAPVGAEGPDPAGAAPGGREPVSVAALVAGVLPTGPVAVVLGVIGLVRTRRRRGRIFAAVGLVLGLVWSGLAAVLLPAMLDPVVEDDASEVVVVPAVNMQRGNCVRDLPDGQVTDVTVVPCVQQHAAQVIAAGMLPEDVGTTTQADQAALFCREQLATLELDGGEPVTLVAAGGQVACLVEWPSEVTTDLVG